MLNTSAHCAKMVTSSAGKISAGTERAGEFQLKAEDEEQHNAERGEVLSQAQYLSPTIRSMYGRLTSTSSRSNPTTLLAAR